MPVYVPTVECLDSILGVMPGLGWRRLSGARLLGILNGLAVANWPEGLQDCSDLLAHPRSAALAFSLVLLWPSDTLNAAEAVREFIVLRNELLKAWPAIRESLERELGRPVSDGEFNGIQLQKTVSHAIVRSIQREIASKIQYDSAPALEVLYYSILGSAPAGAEIDRSSPIGKAVYFLRGGAATIGQPNHLDACWGENFADNAPYHAAGIMSRLLKASPAELKFMSGSSIRFQWLCDDDGGFIRLRGQSRERIRAGSTRTYKLTAGSGMMLRNGELFKDREKNAYILAGERLTLQVRDAKAVIKRARGPNDGPEFQFFPKDKVKLVFCGESESSLEVWPCTCGSWDCDQKHRITGWDLQTLNPRATFQSFLHTAVNGPNRILQVKSFAQGMYYALLCDGE